MIPRILMMFERQTGTENRSFTPDNVSIRLDRRDTDTYMISPSNIEIIFFDVICSRDRCTLATIRLR